MRDLEGTILSAFLLYLRRTDKAVAQLGYAPIVAHATGFQAVRDALAAH